MTLQAGSLTFVVERFNTGIVSKRNKRQRNEDAYALSQDIGLDQVLKMSFYTVIDGHGGDWCAQYLQTEMIPFYLRTLRQELGAFLKEGEAELEVNADRVSTIIK